MKYKQDGENCMTNSGAHTAPLVMLGQLNKRLETHYACSLQRLNKVFIPGRSRCKWEIKD